jgi:hypothetical protein
MRDRCGNRSQGVIRTRLMQINSQTRRSVDAEKASDVEAQ